MAHFEILRSTCLTKAALAFFLLVFSISCHKDTSQCPPQIVHSVPPFYRSFNFKPNSKWIFKNVSTNAVDTMLGGGSGVSTTSQYSSSHHPCPYDAFESFTCSFSHHMFPGSAAGFAIHVDDKVLLLSAGYAGLFQQNVGDSINYGSTWVKLEDFYSSLTINSSTFSNVYQMYYYPSLCGFRRIWWCPNVGFVKMEFINSVTQQVEDWEVTTYSVEVY